MFLLVEGEGMQWFDAIEYITAPICSGRMCQQKNADKQLLLEKIRAKNMGLGELEIQMEREV